MQPIKNCETIEIALTSGVRQYKLPQQTNFVGQKIVAIETYLPTDVTKSPLNKAVCNGTAMALGYLTLSSDAKEFIKDQPLVAMSQGYTFGRKLEVGGAAINNDKSYIAFADPSKITTGEVALLTFYW